MNPPRPVCSILVVDDIAEMRETLIRLLKALGHTSVREAKNGSEASALLVDSTFDLVLCDWNMPGKTGIELLRQVRGLPGGARIPFIMITGENQRERIEAAIAAGVTDYLLKPFSLKQLESKLDAAMSAFRD